MNYFQISNYENKRRTRKNQTPSSQPNNDPSTTDTKKITINCSMVNTGNLEPQWKQSIVELVITGLAEKETICNNLISPKVIAMKMSHSGLASINANAQHELTLILESFKAHDAMDNLGISSHR